MRLDHRGRLVELLIMLILLIFGIISLSLLFFLLGFFSLLLIILLQIGRRPLEALTIWAAINWLGNRSYKIEWAAGCGSRVTEEAGGMDLN